MVPVPQIVPIHRLGSLGDTAIMLPVFHHLNDIRPKAEKRVMTNFPVAFVAPPLQAVLGDDTFANDYFAIPTGTRSPRALLSLASDAAHETAGRSIPAAQAAEACLDMLRAD